MRKEIELTENDIRRKSNYIYLTIVTLLSTTLGVLVWFAIS